MFVVELAPHVGHIPQKLSNTPLVNLPDPVTKKFVSEILGPVL
jgi:hypothetical protein